MSVAVRMPRTRRVSERLPLETRSRRSEGGQKPRAPISPHVKDRGLHKVQVRQGTPTKLLLPPDRSAATAQPGESDGLRDGASSNPRGPETLTVASIDPKIH